MAVATPGGLKGVTAEQAERLGQGILLANTYHLALRPGAERVRALGGLHAFSGWRGPMLTDSGGYQVFSLADRVRLNEQGVRFRNHLDGGELSLGPEDSIRIQRLLGADIVMAMDMCPDARAPRELIETAVARTSRWFARCQTAFAAADLPGGQGEQALFAIVQGGLHDDLRARSAAELLVQQPAGIAIGGLAVGETAAERLLVLDGLLPRLPAGTVRYLMGVGTPLDLVESVLRGVDLFDCVLPTRMGRHGIAYTDQGPLRLKRAEFADSREPIDADTASEATRHSRGFLRHLLCSGEILGGCLLSLHNLAYYQRLMQRLRAAIAADKLEVFAAAFRAGYANGGS